MRLSAHISVVVVGLWWWVGGERATTRCEQLRLQGHRSSPRGSRPVLPGAAGPNPQRDLTRQSSMPGGRPHVGGRLYRLRQAGRSKGGHTLMRLGWRAPQAGRPGRQAGTAGAATKASRQHAWVGQTALPAARNAPPALPHRRRRSRAWQLYQAPKLVIRQEPAGRTARDSKGCLPKFAACLPAAHFVAQHQSAAVAPSAAAEVMLAAATVAAPVRVGSHIAG